jgi:hypothetical protein
MPRSVARQLARTAVASLLAAVSLSSAQPALAGTPAAVRVPCSSAALAAAIAWAVSGETLAPVPSCRYVLTAPLPAISGNLTIQGSEATLERIRATVRTRTAMRRGARRRACLARALYRRPTRRTHPVPGPAGVPAITHPSWPGWSADGRAGRSQG